MLNSVFMFALGLVLLIKGGDWFVDGAGGLAKRFHMPELLIGATVVSIGTTLPEVMVSATSAVQGLGSMAYGNAIGSIICNTSFIAALTIAIKPTFADKKELRIPVLFFFIAAVFYTVVSYAFGYFSRIVGIFLLLIFALYIAINTVSALKASKSGDFAEDIQDNDGNSDLFRRLIFFFIALICFILGCITGRFEVFSFLSVVALLLIELVLFLFDNRDKLKTNQTFSFVKDLILLVVGAAVITNGANLLVNNGTLLATAIGVPNSVIAITFVALGTSLPELVTAITALVKGHSSLSLGNIIGANLFNLVLVSGVSVTLNPFKVPNEKVLFGMNSSLVLEIPLMLAVMLILTLPPLIKGKLSRWQGISLLTVYAAFVFVQFVL